MKVCNTPLKRYRIFLYSINVYDAYAFLVLLNILKMSERTIHWQMLLYRYAM
jgi:hypothetical protein